jgi:hypothetical protein
VTFAGGDLLPDQKHDREPLVTRTSDKLSGHVNAVVVREDPPPSSPLTQIGRSTPRGPSSCRQDTTFGESGLRSRHPSFRVRTDDAGQTGPYFDEAG